MLPQTRPATAADVAALTGVLARAFAEDPVVAWTFADPGARARCSPRFFAWELRRLLGQDVTWTTADTAGAALWALPGQWRETPLQTARLMAAVASGIRLRAPRVLLGLNRIEHLHPEERHLYLAVLGVDPRFQGTGVGSALLQPGLQLCDDERLPAYLETATERNLAFYGRHGFRITGELRLPKGPPVWTMWRDPR